MAKKATKAGNDTDTHVGQEIKKHRLIRGLSQTALADELGISFQQIQKYERGTNRVSASKLQAIADYLRVPVASFFDASAHKAQPAPWGDLLATKEGIRLNTAFAKLKDGKLRQMIVDLCEHHAANGR